MWSGASDTNAKGECVRVFHPIMYGRKPRQADRTCSFIGGKSVTNEINCASCQEPLQLLLQHFVPKAPLASGDSFQEEVAVKDRTLQVFACNSAACINGLFAKQDDYLSPLNFGGDGVVVCRRAVDTSLDSSPIDEVKQDISMGNEDPAENNDINENDWEVDVATTDDSTMEDLESKLASMETAKNVVSTSGTSTQSPVIISKKPDKAKTSSLHPCYELHSMNEPASKRGGEAIDEDDVGCSGSDNKIQKMLARYMAEEEDEDILAALRASVRGSNGGGCGGRGERDERMSAEDRALLAFSDRLKRSPQQVMRYAYGGTPMWSIPTYSAQESKNIKKNTKKSMNKVATLEPIPNCPCGAARVFEFQILPSLLHVLDVDKYAKKGASSVGDSMGLATAFEQGGMNWGNIAIYSCPKACSYSDQEYVVVQDSLDERPIVPTRALRPSDTQPVVIQENTKFNDSDDEANNEEDNGMEEDDFEEDC